MADEPILLQMNLEALRVDRLARRSTAGRSLVLIAVVASLLCVLMGFVLAAQRDGVHIININGAQRMRVQRIAYLALAGRQPNAAPSVRIELAATIRDMLRVRKELLARRDLSPTLPDASGMTDVAYAVSRYTRAARTLVRDPYDEPAFAYITANRNLLFTMVDATVTARTNILEWRNTQLVIGLVAGLVVILIVIVTVWVRLIEPTERRMAELMARLNTSEAQMRSLFRENPDAIAMYDADGLAIRGNLAIITLLGQGAEESPNAHYLARVGMPERPAITRAFNEALAGHSTTLDTVFISLQGERIDVNASIFPHVVDGTVAGVIGVAKDMRAQRRAEAEALAQSERIAELCRVTALHNLSSKRQLEEILAVTAQRLGYDWAAAVEIGHGRLRAVAVVGDTGIDEADLRSIDRRLVERMRRANGTWSFDRLATSALRNERIIVTSKLATLAGSQLVVNGIVYGAVLVGAARERKTPLATTDLEFLQLVSTILGAGVDRVRHEEKLDTLAFFDGLTGLPNRVLLADRMTALLESASIRPMRFAVHCLDLDNFKAVNDTFGHAEGDEVLKIAAQRMMQCVRTSDTVARVGGDEFVILQYLDESGRGTREVADRVLAAISMPFRVGAHEYHVGVSIGTSVYPRDGMDAATLLTEADGALLQAKRTGRNRQTFAAA